MAWVIGETISSLEFFPFRRDNAMKCTAKVRSIICSRCYGNEATPEMAAPVISASDGFSQLDRCIRDLRMIEIFRVRVNKRYERERYGRRNI